MSSTNGMGYKMLSDEKLKDLYMLRSGCGEQYARNGIGRRRFDANVKFIIEALKNEGIIPSGKAYEESIGTTTLYRLGGDSIILKNDGIQITFEDGDYKWFSMMRFMEHLKIYRTLMERVKKLSSFFQKNTDEW